MRDEPSQVAGVFADPAFAPGSGARAGDHPVWVERRDCTSATAVGAEVCAALRDWAAAVVAAPDPTTALERHATQRLLCARRRGPLGAEWCNRLLEATLEREGLIAPWEDGHYPGRPLLVTRNDYDLQLYNGDIGIVHGERGRAQAWFATGAAGLRGVPLHRLHGIEPVFAMTIHKSQGSQFDHVEIVTAPDDAGPVGELLTRELLYTAVTRAAFSARLWADDGLLSRALARRKVRRTGFGRFLRAAGAG